MDYIIIVAGGKGLRMGSDIPKQFLPVGGLPVLMHTIKRFREYSQEMQIILVLPEAQQDYWHGLCKEYAFDVEYIETFEQIKNRVFEVCKRNDVVLILGAGSIEKLADMF